MGKMSVVIPRNKLERKKENLQIKSKVSFYKSIIFKMIGAFLVPVVFIIALGAISYQMASSGMIEKYEQSTQITLNMTQKYFEVILNTVQGKATQLNTNSSVTNYYSGVYSFESYKEISSLEEIRNLSNSLHELMTI